MKSVIAWWSDGRDPPFVRLPICEVIEHGQRHGWLDRELHYLCLDGDDAGVRATADYLGRHGIASHDLRALRHEIAATFPWLRGRVGRFFDCFLRWLVIERFAAGEPVISWDADIFFNTRLSDVHRMLAGRTGTAGSTCFAAIHDPRWFEAYARELADFEQTKEDYVKTLDRDYATLRERGMLGWPTDSVFGKRMAAALDYEGSMTRIFNDTPEEIFVDRLLRRGRLPQDWFLAINGHIVCTQLLTLPELPWVSATKEVDRARVQSPVRFHSRDGRYFLGDEPMLFLHFQGAVYRLCAAHWILVSRTGGGGRLGTRLKSRLHPGDLPGVFAEEVLEDYFAHRPGGPVPEEATGRAEETAVGPPVPVWEARVARRYLLDGSLEEVFNRDVLDHSSVWQ